MKHIDKKTSIIISILFPVLIVAWNLGFDLGVFGTVLYRNLMNAWIFVTATLITTVYLKWRHKIYVNFFSFFLIFLGTLWPLLDFLDQHAESDIIHYMVVAYYGIMAISLGYTLYVFLKLIKYDIFEPLTKTHLVFVIISVLAVGFSGYQLGSHHYLFLACGHFRISGEFIPPNCYKHPSHNFPTFYRKAWKS